MDAPKIGWYSKLADGELYAPRNTFYAGTYSAGETLSISIQIWNNRWGVTDVADLENFNIMFYFRDYEDSTLLENCSVYYKGNQIDLTIDDKKALVPFGTSLVISGKANDGSSSNVDNINNFITLLFTFKSDSQTLKEHDLKQLVFEIVSL